MYVSQRTMFATLPLIAIYLLALSILTDSIALRLRIKSRELERIAMMDPLLDIANRRLLEKRIDHELNKLRQTCRESALMFIDIDNFKDVNDRFGHKVGDALLAAVSQILHLSTRPNDTPARLGGDEFVVLLPDTTLEEAQVVARRIMDAAAMKKGGGSGDGALHAQHRYRLCHARNDKRNRLATGRGQRPVPRQAGR